MAEVLRSRGIKLRREKPGYFYYNYERYGIAKIDQAKDQVAWWLGFKTFEDYLETLPKEKEQIFKRATY